MYDVLINQNIAIKNIEDIKLLITTILYSGNTLTSKDPRQQVKQGNSSKSREDKRIIDNAKKAEITEEKLKEIHKSKEKHRFKLIDGSFKEVEIQWTINDEIELALNTIETKLKNNSASSRFSMDCDKSYDMYSLVSMLSGSANKPAYLTNVILRYGTLKYKDLLNLIQDD